ncbi:DUF4124 domain-containing protein [Acinetobacter bereziniae]|uniref:DUF4124 domain-containing protein n=1 Tax=Acinetobacter bereziniae TaxID=106648 RepID=UPI003AF82A93
MSVLKITTFILLCIPVNLYAGVYKWVDAKGNVTYSSKPPPKGQKAAPIETIRSIRVTPSKSATRHEFKSNSSIPNEYHNPYQSNAPLRQNTPRPPERTPEQEAERQALLKAASTPYPGSQGGLTAAQLRTRAALLGVDVPPDNSSNSNNSYSATMPQRQPSTITNCDGSGCWGSDGTRYNRGAGDTYFPSTGGVCQGVGGQMQCN